MSPEQPSPRGNERIEQTEKPASSPESNDQHRQEFQNLLDLKDKALGKLRSLGVDPEKNEGLKPHIDKVQQVQREIQSKQLEAGNEFANALKGITERIRPDIYSIIDITLTFERVSQCSKPELPPAKQASLLVAVNAYNRAEQQCLERLKKGGPEGEEWKQSYATGANTLREKLQNVTPDTVDATIADINKAVQTWDRWEQEANDKNAAGQSPVERQQVVMKNGRIYRGVFEDGGADYYKHWETAEEREKNPRGYTTIVKEDVKETGPIRPAGKEVESVPELQQVVMTDKSVRRGVFELSRSGDVYKYWASAAAKMMNPDSYSMILKSDVQEAPGPIRPAGKEIEPPPERQEVVMKNGRIFRGIFVRSGEYFKHWDTVEEQQKDPTGYRVRLLENIQNGPGPVTARTEAVPEKPQVIRQQVVTDKDAVIRGVFEDGGSEYYKFWPTAEGKEKDPTGYRLIFKDKIKGAPGPVTSDREAVPEQHVAFRQVVLKKNGIVLQGVFEKHGNSYRFWKSADERKTEPYGYRRISRNDLEGPASPIPANGQESSSIEPSDAVRKMLTQKDEVLEGIFELNGDHYRYWETAQDRKDDPREYRVIHVDDVKIPPKNPAVFQRESEAA